MDIAATKKGLRERATSLRDSLTPAERHEKSEACAERMAGLLSRLPAGIFSFYWPMRSELDPRPLAGLLTGSGWRACLPRMTGTGRPLDFHEYAGTASLVPGPFGTSEPPAEAPRLRPDLVIAPMLAFDPMGFRLGYGGGFYDRTLEKLKAGGEVLAVGLAFELQRMDRVPVGEFDQKLEIVATEAATYGTGAV
jgi:5-formyltetrahydrofolate cyclo-ligase